MPTVIASIVEAGHEVTWYQGDEVGGREVVGRFPSATLSSAWESLLTGQVVDLAIVGRSSSAVERLEQSRRLIQHGVPVILPHPFSHSAIDYYELDMLHRESGSAVWFDRVPSGHPAIEACADWLRAHSGSQNTILTLERTYCGNSNPDWETQFTRDLGVLDGVGIIPRKISGLADSSNQLPYLEISLGIESGRPLRWTFAPGDAASGRLLIEAGPERAELIFSGDYQDWTFLGGKNEVAGNAILRWPLDSLAGNANRGNAPPLDNCATATRDIEILEAARKSLARGRVVEIFSSSSDQETSFKGIMAASGCVLLLGAIVLLFAVAIAQQVAEELKAQRLAQLLGNWPLLLLGALAIFLVAQGLLFVARREKTARASGASTSRGHGSSP